MQRIMIRPVFLIALLFFSFQLFSQSVFRINGIVKRQMIIKDSRCNFNCKIYRTTVETDDIGSFKLEFTGDYSIEILIQKEHILIKPIKYSLLI
jgi:hypothetical protein